MAILLCLIAVVGFVAIGGVSLLVGSVGKIGSSLKNIKEGIKGEKAYKDATDTVSEYLKQSDFTAETKAKMADYTNAANAYREVTAKGTNLTFSEKIGGWFENPGLYWPSAENVYNVKVNKATSAMTTAETDMFNAINSDELYQATLADNRAAQSNQKKKMGMGIGIILAVIILLLLLFLWLNKRAHKPKARPAAPTPPKPAVEQTQQYQIEDHQVKLKADKMNACRSMAKKYGLNADDELVKYNGDVDKLWMSLIQMQPLKDEEGGA